MHLKATMYFLPAAGHRYQHAAFPIDPIRDMLNNMPHKKIKPRRRSPLKQDKKVAANGKFFFFDFGPERPREKIVTRVIR